jgi:hypothetical protein
MSVMFTTIRHVQIYIRMCDTSTCYKTHSRHSLLHWHSVTMIFWGKSITLIGHSYTDRCIKLCIVHSLFCVREFKTISRVHLWSARGCGQQILCGGFQIICLKLHAISRAAGCSYSDETACEIRTPFCQKHLMMLPILKWLLTTAESKYLQLQLRKVLYRRGG